MSILAISEPALPSLVSIHVWRKVIVFPNDGLGVNLICIRRILAVLNPAGSDGPSRHSIIPLASKQWSGQSLALGSPSCKAFSSDRMRLLSGANGLTSNHSSISLISCTSSEYSSSPGLRLSLRDRGSLLRKKGSDPVFGGLTAI